MPAWCQVQTSALSVRRAIILGEYVLGARQDVATECLFLQAQLKKPGASTANKPRTNATGPKGKFSVSNYVRTGSRSGGHEPLITTANETPRYSAPPAHMSACPSCSSAIPTIRITCHPALKVARRKVAKTELHDESTEHTTHHTDSSIAATKSLSIWLRHTVCQHHTR